MVLVPLPRRVPAFLFASVRCNARKRCSHTLNQARMLVKPLLVATVLLLTFVMRSAPASAAPITFTDAMDGFTYDSDTQSAAFLAALGFGYTHISFQGATDTNGASYSPLVTFSTRAGIFGGSDTSSVNADSEIGPFGSWDGILNIDFLANDNSATAVGFGLVEFDTSAELIRVYDDLNNLIGTFNDQLTGLVFSLWGIDGNGQRIGRIELDGNFFAIQDIEFDLSAQQPIPEPASMLLVGLGLAGLRAVRAARRRRA
jgi:hypothetical protein